MPLILYMVYKVYMFSIHFMLRRQIFIEVMHKFYVRNWVFIIVTIMNDLRISFVSAKKNVNKLLIQMRSQTYIRRFHYTLKQAFFVEIKIPVIHSRCR